MDRPTFVPCGSACTVKCAGPVVVVRMNPLALSNMTSRGNGCPPTAVPFAVGAAGTAGAVQQAVRRPTAAAVMNHRRIPD